MIFERSITDSIFVVDALPEHAFLGTAGFAGQSAPLYVRKDQVGIVYERGGKSERNPQFMSEHVIPNGLSFSNSASINSVAPLYVLDDGDRRANFDESKLKELFSDVEQPDEESRKVYPEDIIDYTYASLHSPSYREKYKEFLKTDFPRVPRPASWESFWRLVELGRQLRELHLMKSPVANRYTTTFPETGENVVEFVRWDKTFKLGNEAVDGSKNEQQFGGVYINNTQYFGNIPELAWNFYIGGYQPAQKWLKDRKGRVLNDTDLDHYQKIIKILVETDRIMKQIG